MKKFFWLAATLLVFSCVVFFAIVPRIVDSSLNRVVPTPTGGVSSSANKLHRDLRIADLHPDSLLWGRDLIKKAQQGEVDVPRLIEGNVALQVFTAVTKTPRGLNYERNVGTTANVLSLGLAQRWPPRTWNSLTERALYQASQFDDAVSHSEGRLVPIRTSADLKNYLKRRETEKSTTAGLLGLEGAHALDGKIDNLDRLFAAGYR
jgi:membrane dipeptidase